MKPVLFAMVITGLVACSEDAPEMTDDPTAIRALRTLSSDEMQGRLAGTEGAAKARDYILSELARMPCLEVDVQPFEFGVKGEEGFNIVADYDDIDAGPLLVVTAHYDHLGPGPTGEIFNGADDNASGVGAVLKLAEDACETERVHDVRFVFYDAEEQGLAGARRYVEAADGFDGRAVFNLNLDMVSQDDGGEIFASGTRGEPALRDLLDGVAKPDGVTLRYGYDNPADPPNDWTNQSDHAAFKGAGLPFLYLGVEDHPHYHAVTDEFESIPLEDYLNFITLISNIEMALDANLADLAEVQGD